MENQLVDQQLEQSDLIETLSIEVGEIVKLQRSIVSLANINNELKHQLSEIQFDETKLEVSISLQELKFIALKKSASNKINTLRYRLLLYKKKMNKYSKLKRKYNIQMSSYRSSLNQITNAAVTTFNNQTDFISKINKDLNHLNEKIIMIDKNKESIFDELQQKLLANDFLEETISNLKSSINRITNDNNHLNNKVFDQMEIIKSLHNINNDNSSIIEDLNAENILLRHFLSGNANNSNNNDNNVGNPTGDLNNNFAEMKMITDDKTLDNYTEASINNTEIDLEAFDHNAKDMMKIMIDKETNVASDDLTLKTNQSYENQIQDYNYIIGDLKIQNCELITKIEELELHQSNINMEKQNLLEKLLTTEKYSAKLQLKIDECLKESENKSLSNNSLIETNFKIQKELIDLQTSHDSLLDEYNNILSTCCTNNETILSEVNVDTGSEDNESINGLMKLNDILNSEVLEANKEICKLIVQQSSIIEYSTDQSNDSDINVNSLSDFCDDNSIHRQQVINSSNNLNSAEQSLSANSQKYDLIIDNVAREMKLGSPTTYSSVDNVDINIEEELISDDKSNCIRLRDFSGTNESISIDNSNKSLFDKEDVNPLEGESNQSEVISDAKNIDDIKNDLSVIDVEYNSSDSCTQINHFIDNPTDGVVNNNIRFVKYLDQTIYIKYIMDAHLHYLNDILQLVHIILFQEQRSDNIQYEFIGFVSYHKAIHYIYKVIVDKLKEGCSIDNLINSKMDTSAFTNKLSSLNESVSQELSTFNGISNIYI